MNQLFNIKVFGFLSFFLVGFEVTVFSVLINRVGWTVHHLYWPYFLSEVMVNVKGEGAICDAY